MTATVIRFPHETKPRVRADHQTQAGGVTCSAHLERHYPSRREAHEYLASRGFLFLPFGWANGRWRARVDIRHDDVVVLVSIATANAA
jgi:hypothetical protein